MQKKEYRVYNKKAEVEVGAPVIDLVNTGYRFRQHWRRFIFKDLGNFERAKSNILKKVGGLRNIAI